jgi:hypothetical protein
MRCRQSRWVIAASQSCASAHAATCARARSRRGEPASLPDDNASFELTCRRWPASGVVGRTWMCAAARAGSPSCAARVPTRRRSSCHRSGATRSPSRLYERRAGRRGRLPAVSVRAVAVGRALDATGRRLARHRWGTGATGGRPVRTPDRVRLGRSTRRAALRLRAASGHRSRAPSSAWRPAEPGRPVRLTHMSSSVSAREGCLRLVATTVS